MRQERPRRTKARRASSIRGLMVDPARLIERHEFYFHLLEWMAEWGLNTLWWHFADDQGFMLKLRSHPELAAPHAFSRSEMKRLLARADQFGIAVVPEVEALGHARYVTGLPQYAELADGDAFAFNAVCPSHPRTLGLLEEIIGEVTGLFDGPYLHAGMDEVNLGGCPRCRRRARGRPRWWIYAQHVGAVHEIVRSAGKEMIIWADHVENDPAMLRALPKDVILAHWQYRQIRRDPIRRSLAAGFRVIGCPALCHHGDVIMSNAANFQNMDEMATFLRGLGGGSQWRRSRSEAVRRGVLGAVNTWWTAWRGLRDAYLPAVAYTGELLRAGSAVSKAGFARRFGRRFFGAGSAAVAKALWELHALMLGRGELLACLFDSPADMHEALKLAEQEAFVQRGRGIEECLATLRAAQRQVRRHRSEFAALVLAGEVAALCCRRASDLACALAEYRRAELAHDHGRPARQVVPLLENAAGVLRRMQRQLRSAVRAVSSEWDRTRYRNDPKKGLKGDLRCGDDALLAGMVRAEQFGAKLAKDLTRAIARYPRTGQLPGGM